MEQTWPNFPMRWTALVEMQKIRSMVNLHPWTSLPHLTPGLQALLLLSWAVYPHLMLISLFFFSACSVPSSHPPGSGIQRFPVPLPMAGGWSWVTSKVPSGPFCDSVITHTWLSTSNPLSSVLWSSGMGSATRKWIQDKLGYRCFIQAASHSMSLQLALSNSSQSCTHFSKLISVINTWYVA